MHRVRHPGEVSGCRPGPVDRQDCEAMAASSPDPRPPMNLPFQPPLEPMLAKLARSIPDGDGWLFEPKWDGFRCIVFRDGDRLELYPASCARSAGTSPNSRRRSLRHCRIVVSSTARSSLPGPGVGPRLRCAAAADPPGRVARSTGSPQRRRRHSWPSISWPSATRRFSTSRWSTVELRSVEALTDERHRPRDAGDDRPCAWPSDWFHRFEGAGLDGVVAKPLDGTYQPGKRALAKIKHQRTADCAVAGYRIHKDGNGVGSLLLGLFDDRRRHALRRRGRLVLGEATSRTARRTRATNPRRARRSPVAGVGRVGR